VANTSPILKKIISMKLIHVLLLFGLIVADRSLSRAQSSEPSTTLPTVLSTTVDRAQDSAVYSSAIQTTDLDGSVSIRTNQFVLLENAMNYQDESGAWKKSEDIIESFPDGATARQGPHKAIFSNELNSPDVFDLQDSDGHRVTGGIRALQVTDVASGRSMLLATVKPTVTAQLLPPTQILFENCMEGGLKIDVIYTWRHNLFAQDIILKSRPLLPDGFDPASTRLEILTEFTRSPVPSLNSGGEVDPDHVVIGLGQFDIVPGTSFPIDDGSALTLGNLQPSGEGKHVKKQ
jgi:hypothetical protein